VTPYQERMKESAKRKDRILRLSRKTPKLTQQEIADEVRCSRAYVAQIIKADAKEKRA
jgi:transcriptional regulator with XRE-family HTH domain